MLREPAWRSCGSILRISCGIEKWLNGIATIRARRRLSPEGATVEEFAQWVQETHEMRGQHRQTGQREPSSQSTTSTMSTTSTQSTKSPRTTYAEIAANSALALIAVACALLDCQLTSQAKAFEQEGGFTERLYRIRKEKRGHR